MALVLGGTSVPQGMIPKPTISILSCIMIITNKYQCAPEMILDDDDHDDNVHDHDDER